MSRDGETCRFWHISGVGLHSDSSCSVVEEGQLRQQLPLICRVSMLARVLTAFSSETGRV